MNWWKRWKAYRQKALDEEIKGLMERAIEYVGDLRLENAFLRFWLDKATAIADELQSYSETPIAVRDRAIVELASEYSANHAPEEHLPVVLSREELFEPIVQDAITRLKTRGEQP